MFLRAVFLFYLFIFGARCLSLLLKAENNHCTEPPLPLPPRAVRREQCGRNGSKKIKLSVRKRERELRQHREAEKKLNKFIKPCA